MKKKIDQNPDGPGAASSSDQQSELPYLPTLTLCMLHQLLVNLKRIEPTICRTTAGDYALVIESASLDTADRLAIVPTETGLEIGSVMESDSHGDDVEVEWWLQMGLGGAEMIEEVVHAAAEMGNQPRHLFAETIEALGHLEEPGFAPFAKYLRELCIWDIRDELADAFRA
jgi:hypothetical protein